MTCPLQGHFQRMAVANAQFSHGKDFSIRGETCRQGMQTIWLFLQGKGNVTVLTEPGLIKRDDFVSSLSFKLTET